MTTVFARRARVALHDVLSLGSYKLRRNTRPTDAV